METRKSRCQSLLQKSDSSLRQELCSHRRNGNQSKDVLLIPQELYPDYKPKNETPGWWYVPTEEILGRVCKKGNAFRDLEDFTGKEWDRKNKASCRKCKPEHDRAGRRSGSKKMKISEGEGKMIARELDGSAHQRPVRRTARWQPAVNDDIFDMESDGSSDSEESRDDARPSLGVRMRAADPRYITHEDDDNRGDVIISISNVKELIRLKERLDEAAATVWLTTAEMGFSLTDEQNMLLCPKDVREGKVIDRLDQAEKELRREIVNLLHDFSRIVRRKKSHMGKRFHC
jgi:hypothetical protein